MSYVERKVPSFDGTALFSRKDVPAHPKAIIVIVHGLAEHFNRYDALTTRLLNADYGVYRYDQRGHARSAGPRTFFSHFDVLAKDCKTIVDLAKSEFPNLPIFLIGHSMGGFTVALFGTQYPKNVNGIVMSGALTRYNHAIFGTLPINAPADSYFDNILANGVCSDPQVGIAYANDPLVEKKISVGLLNSLAEGVLYLTTHPLNFVDPVLILHGADDGIVAEKDSRDFFGDIASKDKTLKIYAKLFHEIFNEPCKQSIYNEVIDWLELHG